MRTDAPRLSLAAVPDSVGLARDYVEGILDVAGIEGALTSDIVLAVSEIVTNAVEASEKGDAIDLAVELEGRSFTIDVVNTTTRPLPPSMAWRGGDPLRPRGRGLRIVDHLASMVSLSESDGRVTVTAVFDLSGHRR